MTFRHLAAASAATVLAFVCIETGRAQQPPAAAAQAATPAPAMLDIQGGQMRVITVATGLVHPWSIAFLPDGRTMLVTEKSGRLRVIRDGVLDPAPAYTVPAPPPQGRGAQAGQGARGGQAAGQTAPQAGRGAQAAGANPAADQAQQGGRAGRGGGGQGGGDLLHFVTLHPKFAQNQLVYFSYPKQGELGETLAVARGRFNGSTLVDVKDVFVADAWETGGNLAGRVMFGPDGNLYVTVGDRDRICCNGTDDNSLRMKAQALDNHIGKTLRIRDDGSVPPDNPFVGRAGAKPEIYTYGHRNGYGLAFNPETGELWQAEIGPMGGDEVNILLPGPQLRLAARLHGSQLHRDAGLGPAVVARGHGQPADVLGAVDQPVEPDLLHRRQVPAVEEQPDGRRVERAEPAAHRVQPALTGRATRTAPQAAQHPHP